MNSLEKQHLVRREKLDPAHYLQTLLQETYRVGLISDPELESIQSQSMQLLARKAESYTGGDSSSIRVETAQSLLHSIFYSISIYLKNCPDIDTSLTHLRQKPLAELYKCGQTMIKEQLRNARELYCTVQSNRVATDNIAYNDTLEEGIGSFFTAYDADLAAHDTPASIDYPISSDRLELVGVEYISNYLQKLSLENQFCNRFTGQDLNALLHTHDAHYMDLLINIFELVLVNVIGRTLVGKNTLQLVLEPLDLQYLQSKLENLSNTKLDESLLCAAQQVILMMNLTDQPSQEHIIAATNTLSGRLHNALKRKSLDSVFLVFGAEQPQQFFYYEDSQKMDDYVFRQVTDEIRSCRYVTDKIALIKREIRSITDLADLLEAYCLFDDEFVAVFQTLSDVELALLSKKLPTHIVDPNHHFTDNENEWHHQFEQYLQGLDCSKRERIRKLAESTHVEL